MEEGWDTGIDRAVDRTSEQRPNEPSTERASERPPTTSATKRIRSAAHPTDRTTSPPSENCKRSIPPLTRTNRLAGHQSLAHVAGSWRLVCIQIDSPLAVRCRFVRHSSSHARCSPLHNCVHFIPYTLKSQSWNKLQSRRCCAALVVMEKGKACDPNGMPPLCRPA